jgi:hypothetical protein
MLSISASGKGQFPCLLFFSHRQLGIRASLMSATAQHVGHPQRKDSVPTSCTPFRLQVENAKKFCMSHQEKHRTVSLAVTRRRTIRLVMPCRRIMYSTPALPYDEASLDRTDRPGEACLVSLSSIWQLAKVPTPHLATLPRSRSSLAHRERETKPRKAACPLGPPAWTNRSAIALERIVQTPQPSELGVVKSQCVR